MSADVSGAIIAWVNRRKDLAAEWERIARVEGEASELVEELRRRRDGLPPRQMVDCFRELRAAIRQVERHDA